MIKKPDKIKIKIAIEKIKIFIAQKFGTYIQCPVCHKNSLSVRKSYAVCSNCHAEFGFRMNVSHDAFGGIVKEEMILIE